jgi:hypothetical protein
VVYVPPAYKRLLRHALAIELSPEYMVQAPEISKGVVEKIMAELTALNITVTPVTNAYMMRAGYDLETDGFV